MDRERMLEMLKEGYTPEYVSLVKWREVRRKLISYKLFNPNDISGGLCALCEVYDQSGYCDSCTLCKLAGPCYTSNGVWRKVRSFSSHDRLTNVTNMVNYLQVLVSMYGVRKNE